MSTRNRTSTHLSRSKWTSIVLLCGLTSLLNSAECLANNRRNLFDPIYAFDDIDAHTVRAGLASTSGSTRATSLSNRRAPLPLIESDDSGEGNAKPPVKPVPPSPSQVVRTVSKPPTSVPVVGSTSTTVAKRQATSTIQRFSASPVLTSAAVSESPSTTSTSAPRHWSALENYYAKIRSSMRQPAPVVYAPNNNPSQVQQYPLYVVPERAEQEVEEPALSRLVVPNAYQDSYGVRLSRPNGGSYLDGSVRKTNSQQQHHSQGTIPYIIVQPQNAAFSLPQFNDADQQQAPIKSVPPYYRGKSIDPPRQHLDPLDTIGKGSGSIVTSKATSSKQQRPILVSQETFKALLDRSGASTATSGSKSPTPSNLGRVQQIEWRKLPELLLVQQQQQRIRHQQETFGDWYDQRRTSEQLQEEAYCGPRNYVSIDILPTSGKSPSASLEVPVSLSAGEYPSHMGVYNSSDVSSALADESYLCAATLVHDRYALTLASCVAPAVNKSRPQLVLRAGEWNMDKQQASGSMMKRQVQRVHLFPKYRSDVPLEHNLALLELKEPIDYLASSYVCPACQLQSRQSMRTSACWAPIRNTTLSEYFDAEGEGETKLRRTVNMIELPVELFANDEEACQRHTGVGFFNFQHPNYICAASARGARWRAALNQTDAFGSGVYCNENGNLNLISMLHPIAPATDATSSPSLFGYLDLSYYKPWMRKVISA